MRSFKRASLRIATALAIVTSVAGNDAAFASDHLDSPAVAADPRADIGDLYAWTSPDGRRLNLVMTLVGHSFSDKLAYVFHVDSGTEFGKTTATTTIECRFANMKAVDCKAGDADRAVGDASGQEGIEGKKHRFRVFAGLRDDPFFNNVKGSRDAFKTAAAALHDGAAMNAAGCPQFDDATVRTLLDRWHHTEGGPAKNLLEGWTPASIVVSVDLDVVAKRGKMLAVWAATVAKDRQIDRVGRPLTANALLGPLAPDEVSDRLKDEYNRATPATSRQFLGEIQKGLALYDGYDGQCGNQWLAVSDPKVDPDMHYVKLATLLVDDRLWVNAASAICTQFLAVELASAGDRNASSSDCGGRTPTYNASNIFRSLLVNGTTQGVSDGIERDEHEHSAAVFPFLAPPDAAADSR